MILDVEDELDVFDIARKLEMVSKIEEPSFDLSDEKGESFEIREEWTEEDESDFKQKTSRTSHVPKPKPSVTFKIPPLMDSQAQTKVKPSAIKERIVERKPKKTTDPFVTVTTNQAKESLFKRSLRKTTDTDNSKETFAP